MKEYCSFLQNIKVYNVDVDGGGNNGVTTQVSNISKIIN